MLGAIFILIGLVAFLAAVTEWSVVGFGPLVGGTTMRLVIVAGTTLVLGIQIRYGSFLLYVLEYRATALRQEAPGRDPLRARSTHRPSAAEKETEGIATSPRGLPR